MKGLIMSHHHPQILYKTLFSGGGEWYCGRLPFDFHLVDILFPYKAHGQILKMLMHQVDFEWFWLVIYDVHLGVILLKPVFFFQI